MKNQESTQPTPGDAREDAPIELETLKADLARVRADLASISSNLLERGKQAIQGAGSEVGHYAQDSVKQAQDFVRERPLGTALVALGIGILVGALLQRR